MKVRAVLHGVWPPALLAAALLLAWERAARSGVLPAYVLPAPSEVAARAVSAAPILSAHLVTTLTEAVAGLIVGVVAGALLAIATAASRWLARAVGPLITVTQTIPSIILAPLLVLWLGFGLTPKIVIVALTVFFPVLVAATTAMREADGALADMVRGLGGGRVRTLVVVRIPAALPGALAGLRVAATYAIGAAVVAEYLAASSGLGVVVQRARKSYDVELVLVAIAAVSLLTATVYLVVDALCRVALPWRTS
ncbi:ABC transporter permease [Sanguibacter sp. A247]|uniref:ABC transporter permease n=1 Tax=unclassified Sanguibacter TaxID=2645534 RepID=UPI003FD824CE